MEYSLIIDQGNSYCKFAIFDRTGSLIEKQILNKDFLKELDLLAENYSISKVIYAATGEINQEIIDRIQGFEKSVLASEISDFPVNIEYSSKDTLGIDRIANSCAAKELYPNKNCLIIDIGTCITYDFIDSSGNYQGGAISPGPILRSKSMNDYTANLPLIQISSDHSLIGDTTNESLQSGVYNGIRFEIEGYIDAVSADLPDLTIILTGGYVNLFASAIKIPIFANPNLTLIGLNVILNQHAD